MARYQFSHLQNNSQTYMSPRLVPRYVTYPTDLLTLRPSRVATDSPHLLWLSPAHPCWFSHRRKSPEPVSFRIAPPPLKRPQLFRALSSPLWDTLHKSCRRHSRLRFWATARLDLPT